jgi:hypothetical protein
LFVQLNLLVEGVLHLLPLHEVDIRKGLLKDWLLQLSLNFNLQTYFANSTAVFELMGPFVVELQHTSIEILRNFFLFLFEVWRFKVDLHARNHTTLPALR